MRIISFHTQHDANVAISVDGRIQVILELERLFEERFFRSSWDPKTFKMQWQRALAALPPQLMSRPFDLAITSWVFPSFVSILRQLVPAGQWLTVDHHRAHAALGFYDSPFESALVVSYDGGGNDGTFNTYRADEDGIRSLGWHPLNLGAAYRAMATAMEEVTGGKAQPRGGHLALAGKLMGYAALGTPHEPVMEPLRRYYQRYQYPLQALYTLGDELGISLEPDALKETHARDLASSSQRAFEDILLERVHDALRDVGPVDGLVLTGGCALNVVANERIRGEMNLPVHVPCAPGDGGIAAGAIWATHPPRERTPITTCGLKLIDDISADEDGHVGVPISLEELAGRLAEGKIIGVARGNSEVGPRALGNRSILCLPSDVILKDLLNDRIKHREWYRPFAPAIPEEEVHRYAPDAGPAPYMSFAPCLTAEAAHRIPGVVHVDGTARIQTVSEKDHPWFHALLLEVGRRTGDPVLLNTSFNTHGRPLVQHRSRVFEMLGDGGLDAVVIEDHIYQRCQW